MAATRHHHRSGRAAAGQHRADRRRRFDGQRPQTGVEGHRHAPPRLSVEQRPLRHRAVEHLLQTQSLCAELHLVGAMRLGPAALVFDGVGTPVRRATVQFHRIGLADQAVPHATQVERADGANVATPLPPAAVDTFVQDAPLRRRAVLQPLLFEMDQRALAGAEQLMLKGRDRNEGIVRFHCLVPSSAVAQFGPFDCAKTLR